MTAFSLCIIGRNEEEHLERLFTSVQKAFKDYPHEVLFVDTGSEDNTKEVAGKYADKVIDFKWINDFAAARNFAMDNAANDEIFFIDCDEEISYINIKKNYNKTLQNYVIMMKSAKMQ